jgi:putative DNA methylase
MLPATTPRDQFLRAIGILGDPVAARRKNNSSLRAGKIPLGEAEYGYPRAFRHSLTEGDRGALEANAFLSEGTILDPTAGGGTIPFEAARLGLTVQANDLNPLAALIQKATIEYPLVHGAALIQAFKRLAEEFIGRANPKYQGIFPAEEPGTQVLSYLWARTIRCPYCDGLIPLSPNWRLVSDGTGIRLHPHLSDGPNSEGRICTFEIVQNIREQSPGTVADGDATCAFLDCGRVIDSGEVKRQAETGGMGEQLFAIMFKRRIETRTKSGKRGKDKWERSCRAAQPSDDNAREVEALIVERMERWHALDFVPSESLPMDTESWTHGNTPAQYGATRFRDLFSTRQLIGHCIGVETFREMLAEKEKHGELDGLEKATFIYLAFSLDKMLDYNSRFRGGK